MTDASKDILVTGSSGVIGRAIVERLAQGDYRIHLTGRNKQRLVSLQKELSSQGIESTVYYLQLENLANCESVVKSFFRKAKQPYGLVCNAGNLGPVGPFWTLPIPSWRQSVSDNFLSHATMIHAFSKAMAARKRPEGSVVVLSGAGIGNAGDFSTVTSYSTAKAALVHLVEALAGELGDIHVRINAVAPGAVLSGMTEQTLHAGKKANLKFQEAAKHCKKTGGVSPDLAAQLIEFLMSPDSIKITGRLLSARFDQEAARKKGNDIARDAHWYRMRRIDYELFQPK